MMHKKPFAIGVAVILGMLAVGMGSYNSGKTAGMRKCESRSGIRGNNPFDSRPPANNNPCTMYPDEPACRNADNDPHEVNFYGCFYDVGSPCLEGSEDLYVSPKCEADPWFEIVATNYPPKRIEGFNETSSGGFKSFDVKAFHTLVGLIARRHNGPIPPSIPLPHELNPAQQDGLTTAVQMYNGMVDDTERYLTERAERIRLECDAISETFKPLRCLPFEPCMNRGSHREGIENCMGIVKLLEDNGIQVPKQMKCRPEPAAMPYLFKADPPDARGPDDL